MSDQTPPDSGPDPTREPEPVDLTESSEDTAPVAEGQDPPPPPQPTDESKGRGKIIAIVAGVVVLALIAGGLGAFFLLRSDAHTITTPSTAGAMKRNASQEKALATQLGQAETQFKTQAQGTKKCASVKSVKSAVYSQSSAKRGPEGSLVFLGAKLSKELDPKTWTTNCFAKLAKTNGLKVTKVSAGDDSGEGVCAAVSTPQKVAICAWATKDTIGELVPTVPGYDAKQLAAIMRDLREDVEQPE